MSKEISLAREYDHEGPLAVAMPDRGPDYPTFTYSGKKELDLPEEGEMTVKFKKVSETSSTNKDGTHYYECRIEVQSICDVEDDGDEDDAPEAPARGSDKSVSDILDGLMKAHMENSDSKESY
jgi:hypothetical protein